MSSTFSLLRSRTFVVAAFLALGSGGVVVHVAGLPSPAFGTIGEDGPATEASLNNAEDVAAAPNGDIYIADFNSNRLLRIRDGILTVAYRGDFTAGENDFSGVAVGPDGTVYFTTGLAVLSLSPDGTVTELSRDPDELSVQVFAPKLAVGADGTVWRAGGIRPLLERIESDGTRTLIAGSEEAATEAGEGDGGPAADARFSRISDMAIDSRGVIYVSDENTGDVRRIEVDGVVSTVFGAGTIPFTEAADGTAAVDFDYTAGEIGVAVDDSDRLYVVPVLTSTVYRVENGLITTVVGGGNNPGAGSAPLDTQLQAPFRAAVSADDELLILVESGRFLYAVAVAGGGSLVDSVPSPGGINLDPIVIAVSVALTAGMLFLVPFPAEIFNNTLVEHHDQISRWFRKKEDQEVDGIWRKPWGLLLGLVAMALLYGFLDPGFGLNAASLPTFAGLLVGVIVTTMGFALPTLLMRRTKTREWGKLRVLPLALVVGVGCVLLSRVIGFVPGYLYGMALGLLFGAEVGDNDASAEVSVTAIALLVVALGAWFGLGAVRSGDGGSLSEVVEGALAMSTVAAFEGLVFGLLPIHGMPGRVLFKHRRWLWGVIWGVSLLAFFHVLVNPRSGYLVDTALVPVATTYGLLVFFTLVSLVLWAWFRRKDVKASLETG